MCVPDFCVGVIYKNMDPTNTPKTDPEEMTGGRKRQSRRQSRKSRREPVGRKQQSHKGGKSRRARKSRRTTRR